MRVVLKYFFLSLLLLLSQQPLASNAQTTVDPVTGQVSIVIDPATGATLNVTQNEPLDEIKNDPNAIAVGQFLGDDGSTQIQLPFTFELYGQQFNSVWMMSNGVLSFTGQGGGYCCNGEDISQLADGNATHHNYIIAAAWSDLLTPGNENAYYLATAEDITFGWYGVFEYYDPNNLNSFEIQLYNTGTIDMNYGGMDITGHTVSSGITGNLSQDQFVDLYYGSGFSLGTPINPDPGGGGPDPCDLDPLSSPSCPGYQQAFFNQQCTANPLYNASCPGYAQAYHNQQCSLNPLYAIDCPGYQQAYYNQQCSMNPLYDSGCSGYEIAYFNQQCGIDPLYNSGCPGYASAYYNQQCAASPLYDSGCPGYQQAYYTQQCQLDPLYDSGCPGYQQAYYNQQCSANSLYDTGCPGYAQAYYNQQCSVSALYDSGCPGYTEAVFQQNCTANQLFDPQCPGFSVAMALQIQQQQQEEMFSEELIPTTTVDFTEETTGDPVLDQLLSILPEPIELASMQEEIVQTVAVEEVAATEPMEEATPEDEAAAEEMLAELVGESTDEEADSEESDKEEKPSPEKQKAAIAAKIAELKKDLESGNMSAKDVAAAQAKLALLIAFVPGFDQYYVVIPDAPFYQQEQVYQNQQIPQNKDALRFGLASELRHEEMVQMQYNRRQ
jgi:hypothetical protein